MAARGRLRGVRAQRGRRRQIVRGGGLVVVATVALLSGNAVQGRTGLRPRRSLGRVAPHRNPSAMPPARQLGSTVPPRSCATSSTSPLRWAPFPFGVAGWPSPSNWVGPFTNGVKSIVGCPQYSINRSLASRQFCLGTCKFVLFYTTLFPDEHVDQFVKQFCRLFLCAFSRAGH